MTTTVASNASTLADFAPSVKMHHATRAKAARLAATMRLEYPGVLLVAQEGDDIDHEVYMNELAGFAIVVGEEDGDVIWEGEKVPELADVLDACAEAGVNPAGEGDDGEEEPEVSGSVVPEKYRDIYRLVSTTGTTNGDWLAEWLVTNTQNSLGQLSIEDLTAIFEANGLDTKAKWFNSRGSRGWQGRFRMSGRAVLERVIAVRGWVVDAQNNRVDIPAEFLNELRSKHVTYIAKQTKAAKDAVGA